jgi:hypothetical protein
MAVKPLPRIERWITLANLLPGGEPVDLEKLVRQWNLAFGREPQRRADWGQHRLAEQAYALHVQRARQGRLALEFTEPIRRGRGRPSRESYAIRFRIREGEWMPHDGEELLRIVRAVSQILGAIAEATADGMRQIRAGQPFDWSQCDWLDDLTFEIRPVIAFQPDGRAIVSPDPYRQFLSDLSGVELFRIRICPVCALLFYARRSDAGACSSAHQNVQRVRTSRKPEKEKRAEYRKNRKRNERARQLRKSGAWLEGRKR